jgi:hypothetical protein
VRVRFEGVSGGAGGGGGDDVQVRVRIDGPSRDLDHAREGERQRFIAAAQGRNLG